MSSWTQSKDGNCTDFVLAFIITVTRRRGARLSKCDHHRRRSVFAQAGQDRPRSRVQRDPEPALRSIGGGGLSARKDASHWKSRCGEIVLHGIELFEAQDVSIDRTRGISAGPQPIHQEAEILRDHTVTATNKDTGATRVVETDPDGTLSISSLPPGAYDVLVVQLDRKFCCSVHVDRRRRRMA